MVAAVGLETMSVPGKMILNMVDCQKKHVHASLQMFAGR